jgi:hypothetical protein
VYVFLLITTHSKIGTNRGFCGFGARRRASAIYWKGKEGCHQKRGQANEETNNKFSECTNFDSNSMADIMHSND